MLIYSLNANILLLHLFAPNNAAVHLLLQSTSCCRYTSFFPLICMVLLFRVALRRFQNVFLFCSPPLYPQDTYFHTKAKKKGTCHERNHVPKAAQLIRKATHFRINISVTHNRSSNLV